MPAQRRISQSQIEVLLAAMEANKNMAKGHVDNRSGPLAKQKSQREWDNLAQKLNCCGVGATKCAKEWKIYWNNLKYKARSKYSERRRHMSGTGGGPAWEKGDLSEVEWRIVQILGRGTILGNESVAIPFDDQDNEPRPSTSAQTCSSPALQEPLSVAEPVQRAPTPLVVPDVSSEHTPRPSCSPPALAEPVQHVDAQPPTPLIGLPAVPSEHTPRTYVRRAHVPDVPDWAREIEEINSAAQERIALALENIAQNQISLQQQTTVMINRLLDNQQRLLRLLEQRLPFFVEEP